MTSLFFSQRRAALVSGRRDSTRRRSSLAPSRRLLRVETLESRDLLAVLSINDVAISEGTVGTANAVFTVTLSAANDQQVAVNFATANGTAVAPGDFASQSGSVEFVAGQTQQTITISVRGDTALEPDETFFVNLSTASNATIADDQGEGVVLNDDIQHFIVAAPGFGSEPRVRVHDAASGSLLRDFLAYDAGFLGGVSVATGDFTSDGVPDIVTAAGPSGGPHVKVFDGVTGQMIPGAIGSFYAYDPNFGGGVWVAAADMNGDNVTDVITGAGQGGGPHVRVFSGVNGAVLTEFLAYDFGGNFFGGVRVAVGQTTAGGSPEIVTGPGPGPNTNALVRVWTSTGGLSLSFNAYGAFNPAEAGAFRGGVFVAAGDVTGDGQVDIITGADEGGDPQVKVYQLAPNSRQAAFYAYPRSSVSVGGGVRVAVGYVDGDGVLDIITGEGPSGPGGWVRVFRPGPGETFGLNWSPAQVLNFDPFDSSFRGGVFVAGTSTASIPGGSSLADDASDDDELLTALATENRQAMSPDPLDRVLAEGW